jgi:hypothetical protein
MSLTAKYNPIKARSRKLKKIKLGLMYFLAISDWRGKLNKIIINKGVKFSKWWSQES